MPNTCPTHAQDILTAPICSFLPRGRSFAGLQGAIRGSHNQSQYPGTSIAGGRTAECKSVDLIARLTLRSHCLRSDRLRSDRLPSHCLPSHCARSHCGGRYGISLSGASNTAALQAHFLASKHRRIHSRIYHGFGHGISVCEEFCRLHCVRERQWRRATPAAV
jgi:hypothetical protein